ncbi:MAG: acyl carrier protein [Acidobacteria bacterium]|jgi:acyl carrier protein|nr:acyl carrier protein [Acidobacteriota bacterium]
MRSENSTEQLPQEIIRNYILENISVPSLDNDFDIFEAGIVNSLFAIELMTFLEKSFAIKVTMDDLDMQNFKSVSAAGQFVLRKKEGQSA